MTEWYDIPVQRVLLLDEVDIFNGLFIGLDSTQKPCRDAGLVPIYYRRILDGQLFQYAPVRPCHVATRYRVLIPV